MSPYFPQKESDTHLALAPALIGRTTNRTNNETESEHVEKGLPEDKHLTEYWKIFIVTGGGTEKKVAKTRKNVRLYVTVIREATGEPSLLDRSHFNILVSFVVIK